MSSWDAVTMENPGSPVYRVMDKGPKTRSMSREEKKADLIAHFRKNGFFSEKKKQAAATRIQAHFRGMIVRNPSGVPLPDYWWASTVQKAPQRSLHETWETEPIIYTVESEEEGAAEAEAEAEEAEQVCHPVGWTKKDHYSLLGWQWCGQSCPCCRARAGDTLGACEICLGEASSF